MCKYGTARNEDPNLAFSERQIFHSLSRMPFVDSAEIALILGEPHATVHRTLTSLLAVGIVGRVSHGTADLPSSRRYYLTANGIREAAGILGFETPSDVVRAYPVSKEWLTLLVRRMDAVAAVYRLAASLSPGVDGLRSHVEFHRRGRFDATITLHDGRSFGVVRQGLRDSYIAVESRDALESRDLRLWCCTSWVIGSRFFTLEGVVSRASPGGGPRTQSPERKRASLPRPEWMAQAAPAFDLSPSEKRTLDLITDHPMIPREHLALWLGVSEGRVSQMMRSLVNTWGLVERRGKPGVARYTLSAEGIRYVTHRDRAQLPTTQGIWSTALTTDKQGRTRHVGHRIETWARQTKHADGITWFLSKLEAEARDDPDSELLWSVPTSRSDRAYNWGDSAIAPDAVGQMTAQGLQIPFYLEYELRARHPRGVIARLDPYESYYWSNEHKEDQPPFPTTLFVVDTEDVEATYVRTAARMSRMSLPIFVSCTSVLSRTGILGRSWRPLWEPESPRRALSDLDAYQWDSLYHRMRPVL